MNVSIVYCFSMINIVSKIKKIVKEIVRFDYYFFFDVILNYNKIFYFYYLMLIVVIFDVDNKINKY